MPGKGKGGKKKGGRSRKKDPEPEPEEEEICEGCGMPTDECECGELELEGDDEVPHEDSNTVLSATITVDTEETKALREINEQFVSSMQALEQLTQAGSLHDFVVTHARNSIEARMIQRICETYGIGKDDYHLLLEIIQLPPPLEEIIEPVGPDMTPEEQIAMLKEIEAQEQDSRLDQLFDGEDFFSDGE